jgi:hypothetical protein
MNIPHININFYRNPTDALQFYSYDFCSFFFLDLSEMTQVNLNYYSFDNALPLVLVYFVHQLALLFEHFWKI